MSAPRYLALIREELGNVAYHILKEVFVNGSLNRSELMRLLQLKYEVEPANSFEMITELTLKHFLVGVAQQQEKSAEKKRDIKAKTKEESS